MLHIYEMNRFKFSADQNVTLPESIKTAALAAVKKWESKDHSSSVTRVVSLDCVVDSQGKLRIISFDHTPQGWELVKLHSKNNDSVNVVKTSDSLKNSSSSSFSFNGGTLFPEHPGAILREFENALGGDSFSHNPISYNSYGKYWLWEPVSYKTKDDVIDYDGGFALKTPGLRKVLICSPKEQRSKLKKDKIRGNRTPSQMDRALANYGEMFYQPFIQPMKSPSGDPMIYSLHFERGGKNNRYVFIGGLSIARKNLHIVLNASDVVLGVID